MFAAYDENKKLVWITNVQDHQEYYCPGCGKELRIKAVDSKRVHAHFSHKAGCECSYSVGHDMSPWHFEWQERFPAECREIPLPKEKPVHRADVLINKKVIEFQHSPIKAEAFEARNSFYKSLGYDLVWIFDMTEHVKEICYGDIVLKRRNDLFEGYEASPNGYFLFFEVGNLVYWIKRMIGGRYMINGNPLSKDVLVTILKKAY